MMNLTQDEIFAADMSKANRPPHPTPEDLEAGMLILDPSFGKNSWNDDTAITVHARIKGVGIPCIIDSYKGRITEERMFDKMLELAYYWGISTWVIEANVAQSLIIPYFTLLMQDRKINVDSFAMLPLVSNKTKKEHKIFAMRNAISGGTYAVDESQEDLIDAYLAYNPEQRHEDILDSASMGLVAWTTHGGEVTIRGIQIQLFAMASDSYSEGDSGQPKSWELAPY